MSVGDKVMAALVEVTEIDEVTNDLDLDLFKHDLLDSLGVVQLMVALEAEFGIEISPASFEREQWSTPRKIIEYVESRIGP